MALNAYENGDSKLQCEKVVVLNALWMLMKESGALNDYGGNGFEGLN